MSVEFLSIEFAESVPGETRGIVDQEPHRRQILGSGKDGIGAVAILKIGNNLDRTRGYIVGIVMNMGNHTPAIGKKCSRDVAAHALAGTGDDCGSRLHGALSVIAGRAKQ